MAPRFKNRRDAGRRLAEQLDAYAGRDDVLVLGLPRGGVPVAREVAQALRAPLDVAVVRKLGVPSQPELAMGAIASGGARVLNSEVVDMLDLSDDAIDRVTAQEQAELERRERAFRGDRPPPAMEDRVVILVDDGLATGATMRAAAAAVRARNPTRTIVAVPVAPPETCDTVRQDVDDVVCLLRPEPFFAVGLWYDDFEQVSDEEVAEMLRESRDDDTGDGA